MRIPDRPALLHVCAAAMLLAVAPAGLAQPTYAELAARIAGIDPAVPEQLGELLGAASGIEAATGLSDAQEAQLRADLTAKFSAWTRARADELDPAEWSVKPFFDLQAVQGLSDYEEYADPDAKAYKEQQLTDKFNQWVRNRVDEIDPSDPNSLKAFFDLQNIQATDKYEEHATTETDQYKHDQMGQKFNQWVRNRVDEIDPSDPDSLKVFFDLQHIQATEKYDEFATPDTHQYKEEQMGQKFNDWVRERVDDLDPNDPNFLEELQKLRKVQLCEKYAKFVTTETHQYKEQQLRDKFGQFIRRITDALAPGTPGFMEDLAKLRVLQRSHLYDEFCPEADRLYKEQQVAEKLQGPPGLPPQVVGTWPESGAVEVSILDPLVIAFDRPMIPETIPPAVQITPPIPFVAQGMDNGHVWTVDPEPTWMPGLGHVAMVTPAAISLEGLGLPMPVEILFATRGPGPPPQVIATFPPEGDAEFSGTEPIEIVFDQPMWTETVETALSVSPPFDYLPTWHADNAVLLLEPLAPMPFDTPYTVAIADSAGSATGVPMPGPFELHFFVAMHGPAEVLGTLPANGQERVPAGHPIRISFRRPMDAASVEAALTIDPPIEFIPIWLEANFVLHIEPVYSLEPGAVVTITLADTARTTFGSPLQGGYEFSFTMDDPLYPRMLRLEIAGTDPEVEILADPGDLHEYLASFGPGAPLPVLLFRSSEVDELQPMIDDYLAGLPVDPIASTEYDPATRAARFLDPSAASEGRAFYRAILEH